MLHVTYFRPSDPNIGVEDCGGYTVHPTLHAALSHAAADAEAHGRTHASDAVESAQYAAAAAAFRAAKDADDFRRPSERHYAYTVGSIGAYIAEAATFRAEPNSGRVVVTMHPAVADMIADALSIIGDDDCDRDDDRTYTCDTAHNAAEAIRAALVRIGL